MLDDGVADIVISLHGRFVDAFISGEKCVELRRRTPSIPDGARIWFYAKVPDGRIRAFGMLKAIKVMTPAEIWDCYSSSLNLTQEEFRTYLEDREFASILQFAKIYEVEVPVSLEGARQSDPQFQPPQFFAYVRSERLKSELHTRIEGSRQISHVY
ncbi:MAG: hypothetical protein P8J20_07505 [Novosphingobium sp.]|nr:hypothetical protein [Novosphingobium sp.]